MELYSQRAELERLGYAVVSRSDDELVATRSKWYLDAVATRLRSVVLVRAVPVLSVQIVLSDAERMQAVARELHPSRLPRYLQKSRAVIAVYLADTVEPDARRLCKSAQPVRVFESMFYPAALELSSRSTYSWSGTPWWGGVYYAKFRYVVGRLMQPTSEPTREPVSVFGALMTILVAALLLLGVAALALVAART